MSYAKNNHNNFTFHIVLVIIILSICISLQNSMAFSPIFRQEIKDEPLDLVLRRPIPYGDLKLVSYISDGKTLNATLWLHSPLIVNNKLIPTAIESRYGLLIDADSNPTTGWDGVDYEFYIIAKKSNNTAGITCERVFVQHSAIDLSRKTSGPVDCAEYLENNNSFVFISLDLEKLSFPNQYRIISYANVLDATESRGITNTVDFTNWLEVPLTSFSIKTFPERIELTRGEQKEVTFQIRSSANILYNVTNIYQLENSPYLESVFPTHQYRFGIVPTPITIRASEDAPIGEYSLPLIANISLTNSSFPSIFRNIDIPKTQSSINTKVNLTLTILQPMSISDSIDDMWKKYGGIISFLGAGFTGGLASFMFDRLKGNRKNTTQT